MLNHVIALDWDEDKQPDYVRIGEFYPCNYKKYYFCINGHTTGIAHVGKKRAAPTMVQYKCITTLKTKKCTADCQSWQEQRVLQNVLQNAGQEFKICG